MKSDTTDLRRHWSSLERSNWGHRIAPFSRLTKIPTVQVEIFLILTQNLFKLEGQLEMLPYDKVYSSNTVGSGSNTAPFLSRPPKSVLGHHQIENPLTIPPGRCDNALDNILYIHISPIFERDSPNNSHCLDVSNTWKQLYVWCDVCMGRLYSFMHQLGLATKILQFDMAKSLWKELCEIK